MHTPLLGEVPQNFNKEENSTTIEVKKKAVAQMMRILYNSYP